MWENCSGEACSSIEQNKCKHGGICVDLVVKTECDCKGTGYYGRFCERQVMNANSNPGIPLTRERVGSDCHTHWSQHLYGYQLTRLTRVKCLLTLLALLLIQYDSFRHLNTEIDSTHITRSISPRSVGDMLLTLLTIEQIDYLQY